MFSLVFLRMSVTTGYWEFTANWRVLRQKQVSRTGTSNYNPHILWGVIICPCPWYLLLTQHSSTVLICDWIRFSSSVVITIFRSRWLHPHWTRNIHRDLHHRSRGLHLVDDCLHHALAQICLCAWEDGHAVNPRASLGSNRLTTTLLRTSSAQQQDLVSHFLVS